jgi:hypothetical protein
MADKRIYQLADAGATTGLYLPVDKSGNAEALRIPILALLPNSIYRCNTETVVSGVVTITFLETFPVGTVYAIMPIWGIDAEGNKMDANPYDLTITGFKISFQVAVTFTYLAIIKR